MKQGNVILDYFLKESFQIDEFKRYRKDIKNTDDIEKYNGNLFHALYNTFLLRMWIDPSFLTDVLEKASSDPIAFRQLKDYLMRIYSNNQEYKLLDRYLQGEVNRLSSDLLSEYSANNKITIKREGEYARIILKDGAKLSNIGDEAERFRTLSLKYFSKRHEIAFNNADVDEIIAISTLKREYTTGKNYHYALYSKPSIYDSQNWVGDIYLQDKDNFILDSTKNLVSNIKYYHLYYGPEHSNKRKVHSSVFAFKNPESSKKIIDLLYDITGSHEFNSERDFETKDKVIGDSLTILAVSWFNNKNVKEKLSILNRQYCLSDCYPFNAGDQEIKRLVTNWFLYMNNYANTLLSNYYIDEALVIFEHLIDQCKDKQLKFKYYDIIAKKLLESYRLEESIRYYNEAYKYARNELKDKFLEAKSLTKIAEICYHMGDQEKGQRHINEAYDIALILPLEVKLSVIWTIANCYRRITDYKKEHEYMNLMMDVDAGNILLEYPDFHKRLLELNDPYFKLSSYDYEKWKIKVANGKYNFYNERGIYYYDTFQFKEAIKCLNVDLSIIQNRPLLDTLSICCIMDEELEKAKEYSLMIQKLDPKYPYSFLYLGLILLYENRLDESIAHVKNALTNSMNDSYTYNNIMGIYIIEYARVKNGEPLDNIAYRITEGLPDDKRNGILKDIGNLLLFNGFQEYAYPIYNKIRNVNDKALKSEILSSIARIYMLNGIDDKAILTIDEAIKNNETSPILYYEKALIYRNGLRFDRALEEIEMALKLDSSNPTYTQFKNDLVEISDNVLKLGLIGQQDIIQMLKTGEMLFLDLYKHARGETLDFAPVLSEYGRALETMMHHNISLKLREHILQKYGGTISNNHLYGMKKGKKRIISPLPRPLRKLLDVDANSISLGSWNSLRRNITKSIDNPIAKDVDLFLVDFSYGYTFVSQITSDERYEILASARNESSHIFVKTREDVLRNRSEIISFINIVIEKFY